MIVPQNYTISYMNELERDKIYLLFNLPLKFKPKE